MQPLIDFYKAKRKSLVRVASRRVGPDWAEDAVHDAFERAIKSYPTYNPNISDFGAWFSTLFNRSCYEIKKANGGVSVEIQEWDWVTEPKPDDSYFLNEVLNKIKNYPPHHKQVLYCSFALQYKDRQVSNVTGLSLLNVYRIKERFCTEMRERYGDCSST